MPHRTKTPPPLDNKSASSTGYEFPKSPSLLQSEEGFRQRSVTSPREGEDFFSEKNVIATDLQPPQSPSNIKPYVGLRSKLSLAWVNYASISLIFIILRIFIAMRSINPVVEAIKDKASRSCDALEVATSTVTSLPHFMAGGFNRATIQSVNTTIKGVARIIDLLIVAIEGIIIWLIHVFRSTYKCLLEFALRGSVGVLSESVRVLDEFTKNQLQDIKSKLDNEITGINSSLDQVRKAVEGVGNVFNGGGVQIPSFTLTTDPLNNINLPTTNVVAGLDSLNGNIPSMDEIENKIAGLVSIPFNQLRGTVNGIMSNVKFNETALPVPPKNQVKFCADNLDLSVLDDISRDLTKAAYIGIGIIFGLILIMIAINALVIWFSHVRYKRFINKVSTTTNLISTKTNKESVIEILKIADNPFISRLIIKCSRFFKRLENRNLFRWFTDYILHKPALICLIIGLSGVLGVYLELLVLNVVKNSYKQPISDAISDFSNSVENLINSQLNSTSNNFATDSNNAIGLLENNLNNELFSWVNTTTTTLNNTLNTAVDEITTFVQGTFKDVPVLLTVVQELVNCLIIVKIEGIQKGLTFIKDNAFIGLPRVDNGILLLSKENMNEVVGQVTNKLVGTSDNGEIGGEIGKLFDVYENNLRSDLPLYWTLISIWFVVILMGLIRVLWFIYQRRRRNNSTQPPIQQNDVPQFGKSIKDDDEDKFNNFRSKLKNLKNNRSSQKKMVNPTFPRNYRSPQSSDDDSPFNDNNYRLPPTLPQKPLPLKRHDIRDNNNPFQ